MKDVNKGVATISDEMDRYVVGHDDMKEAILLGVVAREHIYLEGPPGTAKTMLAEITADAADLNFYFYQLHRDTRLAELVGDIVIAREKSTEGELIKQSIKKGGILTAEICVLDDISRAPGEALNVMLRILNERKYGGEKIPLLTAIATSNPTKDEYYNEPLDPANIDRFTIQYKAIGLIQQNMWDEAKKLIDLYADSLIDHNQIVPSVDRSIFDQAYKLMVSVKIPPEVKEALLDLLSTLINDYKLDDSNSLITDRTFLVKALKIIKAKAVLSGRTRAILEDLRVMKYITAFRIPPEVHEQIEEITEEVINKKKIAMEQEPDPQEQAEQADEMNMEEQGEEQGEPIEQAAEEGEQKEVLDKSMSSLIRKELGEGGDEEEQYLQRETIENIELLLKVIKGKVEKSIADQIPHRGGQPRTWQQMRDLDDILDTDPVESSIWSADATPTLPRVYKREKKQSGGELAILRDVSSSMMGRYSKWASAVIVGLVDMARQKRMRVGYIEFNHLSTKYKDSGRFFTKDYEKVLRKAGNIKCSGYTNYQRSLNDALLEFDSKRHRNKHIVFITDGVPTQGDWEVKAERTVAKKQGVAIHSIFIGTNDCPKILRIISDETGGAQFQAATDHRGVVKISERNQGAAR